MNQTTQPEPGRLTPYTQSRDTARRDCRHPTARHVHGTRAAYISDRCGCIRCRAANREAERQRLTAIAAGRPAPYTDAGKVLGHLEILRRHGVGIERIAHVSGVPTGTIRRLLRYPTDPDARPHRVRTATAHRLLAVTDQAGSPRRHVAADDTHRRIADLRATGRALPALAKALGKPPTSLRRSLSRTRVTAGTAHAVAALHAAISSAPQRAAATQPDQPGRPPHLRRAGLARPRSAQAHPRTSRTVVGSAAGPHHLSRPTAREHPPRNESRRCMAGQQEVPGDLTGRRPHHRSPPR
jgi:hypothetical protein